MEARSQSASPTRRVILLAAAGVGVGLASLAPPVSATSAAMEEAIRALVGEATINRGKVRLELPPIVENGNTVPLTVSVESPMTEADHLAAFGTCRKVDQYPRHRPLILRRRPPTSR